MVLSHLQGLLDAAAATATARDRSGHHRFRVSAFPPDEDLLSALAAEGSRRIQATGSGPWQNEALRELRGRLGAPRPTRSRGDVEHRLRAWFQGAPEGPTTDDPVIDALVHVVLADLEVLLGEDWHGERSPLGPEADYAEATLLLGDGSRLLLEFSRTA